MMDVLGTRLRKLQKNPLFGDALSLYAIQGLNYLVPLILLPYLLRVLGPNHYGSIVIAQTLMSYGILLTDFGFNLTAAREISVARADPVAVASIYWTTVASKLLLLAVASLCLAVIVALTPSFRGDWRIFLCCSVMLLGSAVYPQWYLQGLERLRDSAVIQAAAKVLSAAATVVLVRSPADTWIAALISSGPPLWGVIAAVVLRKPLFPVTRYRPTTADIRAALTGSWHMFASMTATSLYSNTNTLVLGLMAGDRAVALFSLAQRLVITLQSIATPLTQAVFPRASLLFDTDHAGAWRLMRRLITILLPSVAGAALLLAVFAPAVVRLIGGVAMTDAGALVRILAITPVFIAVGALPAQIVIVSTGRTRELFRIYLLVGLINLAVMPVLVHWYAAVGAAWSLACAEIIVTVRMVLLASRQRLPRRVAAHSV